MCTHTAVSPTRRYTRSRGDQEEGKRGRRRRRRSAHEREEKGSEENKRTPRRAERLARRAMIKIARSNRRAWCSFDVLYLSVILLSFPTPTGHGDIHAERTPLRYRDPPHADGRAHTYALTYNAGREMSAEDGGYGRDGWEGGQGEDGTHTRARTMHGCLLAVAVVREQARVHDFEGCAPYVHTLINAYR